MQIVAKEYVNAYQVAGGLAVPIYGEKWFLMLEPRDICYSDFLRAALDENAQAILAAFERHKLLEPLPPITVLTIQNWQQKQKGEK